MDELSLPKALAMTPGGVRIGIFLPNEHANQYMTAAPGLTDSTYEINRQVARLADDIGLSFGLTVGRWKGIPGDNVGYAMYGFDTFTLAAALLESTKKITIISTAHTIVWNPVIAAKLGADLDHIGHGRWGLNIVAGWSESEFGSMGLTLMPHDQRYKQATEWLKAVRELWLTGESSHSCEFFTLNEAECHPRPLQEGGPVVVNAGSSPTGMKFAIENGDYLFTQSANGEQFRHVREEMKSDVGYIGRQRVIIARTDLEAREKAEEILREADLLAIATRRGRMVGPDGREMPVQEVKEILARDRTALSNALLGDAIIGSPESVARQLADRATSTSVDGICLALFDCELSLELLAERCFEPLGNALASAGKTLLLL
ncbi:MAG TPA: LLM class flavin-dependent oxidoreductase [Acidimicrobiales bacterium]|nr:LLM class flavin-dependent oxidoreductase [Acidimicrobiales bacterium]